MKRGLREGVDRDIRGGVDRLMIWRSEMSQVIRFKYIIAIRMKVQMTMDLTDGSTSEAPVEQHQQAKKKGFCRFNRTLNISFILEVRHNQSSVSLMTLEAAIFQGGLMSHF